MVGDVTTGKDLNAKNKSQQFLLKNESLNFWQIQVKFCLIFSFFNDHFLLFILASVAANQKIATDSDLWNNIARVLKYAMTKFMLGSWKDRNE